MGSDGSAEALHKGLKRGKVATAVDPLWIYSHGELAAAMRLDSSTGTSRGTRLLKGACPDLG